MRFGLALPHYDFSLPGRTPIGWGQLRDWAQRAEELGFDSIWLSDHLFLDLSKYGGSDELQGALECFTSLAALAAVTRRVRVGTLVVCNELRNPALVAKMAATIDVLSGGRLEVGIGAGWYEREFRAAGVPFERPGKRLERLAEAVQIVRGMLSTSEYSFRGRHYRVEKARNLPQPAQQPGPPVWVGGKGDAVVRLAARFADGFNTVWAWTPEAYLDRVRLLEEAAEEAGRDPASIRRSVGLYALVGQDEMELSSRWHRYLSANPWMPGGLSVQAWGLDKLCGTPQHIARRVDAFADAGVEEVILSFGLLPFQLADASSVEAFVRDVFPLVRTRSSEPEEARQERQRVERRRQ
ncbi:MAG: LLM class flavin-dependent oxidoreductase [Actinomycetota bacterium]